MDSAKGSKPGLPFPAPESLEEILPRQFGKYTLLRALAQGGMASVFLAIQRAVAGFEKLVVIKRILPELSRDQAFVEMLLSEARTAATLNHPNVVQTFDVGEVEGTYYIAMEHINGEDIRSIVRGMRRAGVSEFPMEHTLNIVLGTCAGLAYAHDKRDMGGLPLGIVHRDISPQNILITFTGDVKIVDFGIAKSSEAAIGESTKAGQLKGKVPYMSPEQARGEELDHRSDIFAVGILLFELTTGRRLFKAKSEYETLKLICEREYPRPSQVKPGYPPALEAIVMKALAKEADERYQSARDMQADLEAFIREEKIAVSAVGLAGWMEMLFKDKIEQQKEALQDVKQLADVIASQYSDPGDMYAGTNTGTHIGITGTGYPQQKGRGGMWAAFAAIGIVLGGGGLYAAMSKAPPPAPVSTAGATTSDAPAKKKGKITVNSDPDGAYIRLAGELQGAKTPATLDKLPTDIELEVKISKEGFEDHISKVTLTPDKLEQEVDVKLVKGTVTLVFTVQPAMGRLHLDGKLWSGKENKITELSTGDHKLVFTAPGHIPQVVKWTAAKGETKKVDIVLVKGEAKMPPKPKPTPAGDPAPTKPAPKPKPSGSGTVSVGSRGGFCNNVIVAGRSLGPTPTPPVPVPAGPVSVTCILADGRRIGSGTVVKDGGRARVTISIPK